MQASAVDTDNSARLPESRRFGVSIGGEAKRRAAVRARKSGLLGDSARHFCTISRPTQQDITLFRELFYQLVDGSDKSERRILSASLARNSYTPRTILYYLALDDADIAAPILMFCEALNEFDIVRLVTRLQPQSLEILCRRAKLAPNAIRALIAQGGDLCRDILTRNPALYESPENRALLAGGAVLEEITVKLTGQPGRVPVPEVPKPVAATQRAEPPKQLREQLLSLAGRSGKLGRNVPEALSSAIHRFDHAKPFEPQLVAALRGNSIDAVAGALESWCGLPAKSTHAILENGGNGELLMLFKGLGLSDLGIIQCLMQTAPNITRDMDAYYEAKSLLSKITVEQSRSFLESLGAVTVGGELTDNPKLSTGLSLLASQRRREVAPGVIQSLPPAPHAANRKAVRLSIL